MKLLVYSHFFAPSVGGVETFVLALARGLDGLRSADGRKQFEVTVATQTPGGKPERDALPFRVVRCPGIGGLWKLIRSADVVHVAGPALAPIFLSLLARRRVVVEHHGFQTICPNGQLLIEPAGIPCPGHFMAGHHAKCVRCNAGQGWFFSLKLWLLTFVRRSFCRRVETSVAPTAWLASLLHLPRVTVIPHGLNPEAQPRAPEKGRASPPRIVFLGRLVTTKGVRVLLDAARILAEQNRVFELVIVGDGLERKVLERLSEEVPLSGRVRITGRLEDAQLESVLAGAAAVVVPSLGGEVFGLVVAENMRRGLPVIASALGAFTEVLGDAGLTFQVGDAKELAAKISQVLDDPDSAVRLGRRARERALDFCNFNRMVQAHATIYRKGD